MKVPYYGLDRQYKNLKEELLVATDDVLHTGCLINGPYTKTFEGWLSDRCHTWYAVTVHSGTQALEIIARYLKSNNLQEANVRIPNITYPATLNAFLNAGYNVTIGDTDKNGLLVNDDSFKGHNCYVGLYGASDHEFHKNAIIDGAQHWLEAAGHVGIGMAISFDPTKNLPASGNGGAIVTNLHELYHFATDYKNNGKVDHHTNSGTNTKMSELDCAHLLVRTRYIDQWQERRKMIRKYYIENLRDLPIRCLSEGFERHADQKFVIATEDRDKLNASLFLDGIDCKIHYEQCLSELEVAKGLPAPDMLSTSIMLSRRVMSLPIYPEMTDLEVQYVIDMIRKFYHK